MFPKGRPKKEGTKMKKIMNKAWEIARNAAAKFGGRAVEYIAMALRMAWQEMKSGSIETRIAELEALGFRRWQKNGMDRMYINASTLGLICVYRKSGTISDAEFRGESISNRQARMMADAKTYIDLINRRLVSQSAMLAAAAADLIGADYQYGDTIIAL